MEVDWANANIAHKAGCTMKIMTFMILIMTITRGNF
jgi:hypothetical protein